MKKVIFPCVQISKNLSFWSLIDLILLGILFLVFDQVYNNHSVHRLQAVLSIFSDRNNFTLFEIQEIIDQHRQYIAKDMNDYEYPRGKYGINVSKLDDLMLEKGRQPIRSVIIASWRSGSTFVGDIVNAHPANFYHYEPLLDFGIVKVRGPPLAEAAISNIYAMFNCEFHKLRDYLNYVEANPTTFIHNTYFLRQCMLHKKLCWNPEFVSRFCKIFPFQSMKLVRLRLKIAEVLLKDESLGVRIVLLVRDPRGLMQSRKHQNWCPSNPDCSHPARVCADMISDYKSAFRFKKRYAERFKIVRYEDVSVDPLLNAKNLYEFYGLNFHDNVKNFLETHTKTNFGGLYSTFRNSKVAPFHWRNDLDFEEVAHIQSVCSRAMSLWGYVLAMNETHQKTFNPITEYRLAL